LTHMHDRALIVEDDRSWQQILSEILVDAGLQVDLAESLETAVARLRAAPHRVAVIDLSLGGSDHHNQDGLQVLDSVRRYDPGCVPVLLTGFATVELAVNALTEHGAFSCLRKEKFRRAEFRELVSRALAEARPLATPQPTAGGEAAAGAARESVPVHLALVVEIEAGYQPTLCSSFGEARGYMRRERYDVAVVDLSLAGAGASDANLDGYELLANTQAAGIPTILVSGIATRDDIERAYSERGIFACLEKQTFDRRAFLRIVDEAATIARAGRKLDQLTRREREVLELLAQGHSNKEIAEVLVITTNTVKRHLKAIFNKLEVHSRAGAAAKAISSGLPAEWPGAETTDR
jgi:DNA-binding NarL/FixJ family response regulator